jgi:putative Holliday junction resolvase
MSIHPWPHLLKRIKKGQGLLGLDVGSKTIGVAISDPAWRIATPLATLTRSKVSADIKALADIMRTRDCGGMVIGMPLQMNGEEGPMAQNIRTFAKQILEAKTEFTREPQISFFDERLSTASMQRFLTVDLDMTRKRRAEVIDKLAAHVILQSALDTLHQSTILPPA